MSGSVRFAFVFLLASFVNLAGCADPNPTFVFDAAPIAKDAGTGSALDGAGGQGGNGGSGGGDAGVDDAGGSQ
jgi:hypothetical protein